MVHQTASNSHKKPSPTTCSKSSSSSSSKHSIPATTASSSSGYFPAVANSNVPYESPYAQDKDKKPASRSISEQTLLSAPNPIRASTSAYSSSSSGGSVYTSSPAPPQYRQTTPGTMSNSRTMSSNDKEQLIRSLKTHRINTLSELRRIEKLFASNHAKDVTEAMTSAWAHYVNSNNLLSELRGMTKNYPFSSECLDEAKWQVIGDPASVRSWNYCWLILTKIKSEGLIRKHAQLLAVKPAMWGGRNPSSASVDKLAAACQTEWTRALDQMLRQWATPPIRQDVKLEDLEL